METKQKIFYATVVLSVFTLGIISFNTLYNNIVLTDTMKYLAKTINSTSRRTSSSGSPSPSPTSSPCPPPPKPPSSVSSQPGFNDPISNPLKDPQVESQINNILNSFKDPKTRNTVEDAIKRAIANTDNLIKDGLCAGKHPDEILNEIQEKIDEFLEDKKGNGIPDIVESANKWGHDKFMNGVPLLGIDGFQAKFLDPLVNDENKYKDPKNRCLTSCDRANKQFQP